MSTSPARSGLRAALLLFLLTACSSTPTMVMDLSSDPIGAQVYLSRRGERAYRGQIGPVKGEVDAEKIEEEFLLLGTAPLVYSSPLEERDGGAKLLGIGGTVVCKYQEGVLRFEKHGYETVERRVRFQNGRVRVDVHLSADAADVD